MLQTVSSLSDAPPPYTRTPRVHSSATSPTASSLFSFDTAGSCTYKYTSTAVSLNFNQHKVEGVRLPAYGREGIVAGEVSLRSSGHIESITVTLRGEIKTVIESTCRPTLSSTTTLLDESHVLWSKSNEGDVSVAPRLLPFSLAFPKMAKDQYTTLPPSFIGAIAEATVRVRYKVIVLVRRTGWRSNALVETEIFYLPRCAEVDSSSLSSTPCLGQVPIESPYDLKIVKLTANRILAGKPESSLVDAHLAYPSLVSLSLSRSIPFSIWLSSSEHSTESLQVLVPHISIRVVRGVRVTARGSTVTEDTVVCQKTIRAFDGSDKPGSQVLNLSGRLDIPDHIWRSWEVPEAGSVTYSLRISLPPSVRPEIAYIDHAEPFVLVAGGSTGPGFPDTPDLESMPSPASLLKKTLIYMPMRV